MANRRRNRRQPSNESHNSGSHTRGVANDHRPPLAVTTAPAITAEQFESYQREMTSKMDALITTFHESRPALAIHDDVARGAAAQTHTQHGRNDDEESVEDSLHTSAGTKAKGKRPMYSEERLRSTRQRVKFPAEHLNHHEDYHPSPPREVPPQPGTQVTNGGATQPPLPQVTTNQGAPPPAVVGERKTVPAAPVYYYSAKQYAAPQPTYIPYPTMGTQPSQLPLEEAPPRPGYMTVRPDPRPLHESMYAETMPANYRVPKMAPYTGVEDPISHVQHFADHTDHLGWTDAAKCRAFAATLHGLAKDWYIQLPTGSVYSFTIFRAFFEEKFQDRVLRNREEYQLAVGDQAHGESLKSYLDRFEKALSTIRSYTPVTAYQVLRRGLMKGTPLTKAIADHDIRTYRGLLELMKRHIMLEETEGVALPLPHLKETAMVVQITPTLPTQQATPSTNLSHHNNSKPGPTQRGGAASRRDISGFIPMTMPKEQILTIMGDSLGQPPPQINARSAGNKKVFCSYHKGYGHATDSCYQLAKELDKRAREGTLPDNMWKRSELGRIRPHHAEDQEPPWNGQTIFMLDG